MLRSPGSILSSMTSYGGIIPDRNSLEFCASRSRGQSDRIVMAFQSGSSLADKLKSCTCISPKACVVGAEIDYVEPFSTKYDLCLFILALERFLRRGKKRR